MLDFLKKHTKNDESENEEFLKVVDDLRANKQDEQTFDELEEDWDIDEAEDAAPRGKHARPLHALVSNALPKIAESEDKNSDELWVDDAFEEDSWVDDATSEDNAIFAQHVAPSLPSTIPASGNEGLPQISPEDEALAAQKAQKKRRTALIVWVSVLVLVGVAYVLGIICFSQRFFPNTTAEQVDISMKTVSEASDLLARNIENYQLQVTGQGVDLVIPGEAVDFSLNSENIVADMRKKVNSWAWPVEIFQTHDLSDCVAASFNIQKTAEIVEPVIAEHNKTATPPQDAKIGYVEATKSIGLVPEQYGTELNYDAVLTKVSNSLQRAHRSATLVKSELVPPKLLSSDAGLQKAAENAKTLPTINIKLTIEDERIYVIDAKAMAEWLTVSDTYAVSIDDKKMRDWIEVLAKGFNTVGSTRTYTRPDGKEVSVSGGDYGWVVDTISLQSSLLDAVENSRAATIAVPVEQTAQLFQGIGKADWGKRFIDVDITEQYVRMYDDAGQIILETDCITGAGYDSGRMTPTGVYDINNKGTNVPLYPFENGKKVEEPTVVSYWMPFIENMIGLHDAWWQPYFGGSAYLDGLGSHGCVNLPSSVAAELYDIIQIGDVVVVHY